MSEPQFDLDVVLSLFDDRMTKLEKNEVMDANAIDNIFDRLTVLENEMIDKDLRISKLENFYKDSSKRSLHNG